MSQAAMDRYHYFDTNIFRIGMIGDSILRPVGTQVESDGSHPYMGGKLDAVGRKIYDYLNYNKPIWRSIEHSDWTFTGGSQEAIAFDGISNTDQIRVMTGTNTAEIQVTGYTTLVIWLEGGYTGNAIDTGVVKIEVNEGSGYVDPSSTSFKGYRITTREGKSVNYENPIDTLDTNICYPKHAYDPPGAKNSYCSHLEIQYNDLNPNTTYTFKVSVNSGTIRLGGCFYWTNKTCVVTNHSVPGLNWENLQKCIYNQITINNYQLVLVEALIYHDFASLSDIEENAKKHIRQLLRYQNTRVVLWSCTPVGGVVEDSEPILGSEDPAYTAGQNIGREFNHRVAFNITKPSYADYPDRNAEYRVTVNATDYDLRITSAKVSEENFDDWVYNNVLFFEFPSGYPYGDESYPLTATKQSGNGAASFSLLSEKYTPPPFNTHRDLMREVAKHFRIEFVDMHQHFVDIAAANGETVETQPYLITPESPLYPEYDGGYENYLSRYFDPNHWREAANQPVFEKFRDEIFINFTFK